MKLFKILNPKRIFKNKYNNLTKKLLHSFYINKKIKTLNTFTKPQSKKNYKKNLKEY